MIKNSAPKSSGEDLVKQAVDGFRVVAQALLPASHPESIPNKEAISDEAINNAKDIISDALEAYRRKVSGCMTPIDPLTVTRVLKITVDQAGELPLALRTIGDPLTDLSGPDAAETVEFMHRDVLARGHRLYMLSGRGTGSDPAARRTLGALMDAGARVRVLASELPTVVTLGSDLAILRTAGGEGGPETLLVRGAEVVTILRRIQLALWEQAVEFSSVRRVQTAPLVLDTTQSQVLRKLCEGMKDETAARQMNVSVRTYRRHVASILKTLDVSSRFEAGLKVAELGLLAGSRQARPYGLG